MSKRDWVVKSLVSDGGHGTDMYMIRGHVDNDLAMITLDEVVGDFHRTLGEPSFERTFTKPVPDSTGNCSVIYHIVDPKKCKSAMAVTFVTYD
nr:MAG TPA: hypothetical protein [Caudoviricetes sp.]